MSSSGEASAKAPARLFAICWAFAILYHQIDYREDFTSPLNLLVTTLAVVVILRPLASVFVALAVAQLLLMGRQLPTVFNHWYVVALAGTGIVLAGVAMQHPSAARSTDEPLARLVRLVAPAGRSFLVLLYFLTGWHKLNTDFLNPAISCASVLLDQMASRLGGVAVPAWLDSAAIVFTLVVELGVPIALLVARTRNAAILLALAFHVAMALAGYARFSAAGVALLLLFLPAATQARILAARPLATIQTRALLVAVLLLSALSLPLGHATFLAAQLLLTAWIGWVVLRAGLGATIAAPFRVASGAWMPLVAPGLLLLSGMAPYLGLQTDRAVSMYSNLRTEGGRTNHLIVPTSLQLFGYQRDLVGGIHSDARELRGLTSPPKAIPFAEFRARASEAQHRADSAISVRYGRGAGAYFIADLRADTTLGLPVTWLHRKFMRFRPIEASGPRHCSV